jgi:3-oxoacyl-[acyl-carrier-protein] synthase II
VQQEEVASGDSEPSRASRPFDRQRTGMVLGEGAAAVILEDLTSATARGATIYGEVLGGGSSSVAGPGLLARRDQAMKNALTAALRNTGLAPGDLGSLHAHGLSTRTADVEEAWAINEVFGGRTVPVPVTAAKSYFGNLGAGSGLVELVCCLMALHHGRLFPILNYEDPDPECPISAVTNGGVAPGGALVKLNVTPQGQASALVVRAFEG